LQQRTRTLVIVLLLSSALTIELIPNVSSQQYTTSTSITTSSLTRTATYYSKSYYAITSTETGMLTTTANFTYVALGNCYSGTFIFVNATGPTHLDYSTSGPLTLYVLNWSSAVQWMSSSLAFVSLCAPAASILYQERILAISGINYPVSGRFNIDLPSSGNPYVIYLTGQSSNLAVTLTISPVLVAQTTTATASIPKTITTSATTTLTFATTLEVPFIQTYGYLIVAAVVAVLLLGLLFFTRRMKHLK